MVVNLTETNDLIYHVVIGQSGEFTIFADVIRYVSYPMNSQDFTDSSDILVVLVTSSSLAKTPRRLGRQSS